MGLFHFLIVLMGIIAAGLVTVILMQQSEGGGLGVGGSPSGLMSARGAADFMTRMTSFLAFLFVVTAIALAAVASNRGHTDTIDTSFERQAAPAGDDAPPIVGEDDGAPVNDGMVTPADVNAGEGAGDDGDVPITR